MMTYSIFATRETILLDLFTFTQQQLQSFKQQTFKYINQTFHEICQDKNQVHKIMAGQKKKLRYSEETP